MEIMPEYTQSNPLPPPPEHSRKGMWIGLAIGAIVLFLCGILVVGVYFFGPEIPYISSFFPSPTPTGLFYNNPAAGISLTYPLTWQYSESGDASSGYSITFASSPDILDTPAKASQTGAIMMIGTIILAANDLPFTVDASSMGDTVVGFANIIFTNISPSQNLRTFILSGYPAASGVYTVTSDASNQAAVYITAVLRDATIILFVGVCPQSEWAQHQPTFDSIVNSASIYTP
jgi:hypothetical protein